MKRSFAILFATACGPAVALPEDSGSDSTTGAPATTTPVDTSATSGPGTSVGTMPEPTTFATTEDPSTTTGVSDDCGDSCCAFLCEPDGGGGGGGPCDPWAQDCPRGEKCMPWANDGGHAWNDTRCSPIAASPGQTGDPCTVEGSAVSGLDDCDIGLVCLFVDPDALIGTCVPNCSGSEANPSCDDPATVCEVALEGVIISCLPTCDPLLQDCPEGGACYPGDNGFVCGDALEPVVAIGEPCDYEWDCAAGSLCVAGDILPACASDACCAPYCDTTQPEPCGPDQICMPVYAFGSAPGYCAAP